MLHIKLLLSDKASLSALCDMGWLRPLATPLSSALHIPTLAKDTTSLSGLAGLPTLRGEYDAVLSRRDSDPGEKQIPAGFLGQKVAVARAPGSAFRLFSLEPPVPGPLLRDRILASCPRNLPAECHASNTSTKVDIVG